MNLYHWKYSEILKRYGTGDIVVMAQTLEEAKTKAREVLTMFVHQNESHLNFDNPEDDWDRKEIVSFLEKIEIDLTARVDTFEGATALLFQGSE